MQLELRVPDGWTVRTVGDQRVVMLSPAPSAIVVAWGPLVPFPDDARAWIESAVGANVPADMTLALSLTSRRHTETGWPMWLVTAELVRANGEIAETRLAAFYQLLEYGAVAMVRAARADALDAIRDELVGVLATAAPSWRADGRTVCVADLYR